MRKTILLLGLYFLLNHVPAQSLVTVAGSGAQGNGGDNGPALSAQFSNLTGVAIDNLGNIYISDAAYNRVRKVDRTGNIYDYAGSATGGGGYNGDNILATNATLSEPCDVALDSAGNLYIADQENGRIRRVDFNTGIITTVASGLSAPSGVAVDAGGNLYVTQQDADLISKVDAFGTITNLAEIPGPYGIGLDPAGDVYYTSLGSGIACKLDTAGIITTVATGLSDAEGVAVDYLGNLYIADGSGDRVDKVNTSGVQSTYIGAGGTINVSVGWEAGLSFDPFGNLYIVNNGDYKVQKLGLSTAPVAIFSASDTSICAGSGINFYNLSTNATSGRWLFPGGSPDSSSLANPTGIIYTTPGEYNVELIAANGTLYDTLIKANYIHVYAGARAGVITASQDTVCANTAVNLTVDGDTGSLQWLWSSTGTNFNAIAGDTSASYSSNPLTATIYYRVVASAGGCSDTSAVQPIVVNPLPSAPVLFTPDSSLCSYDSTIIQSSGPYAAYLWNNSDSGSSIRINSAGYYWVTVTDANGCSAVSGQQHITVFPVTPVPALSTADSLFCPSDSTSITATGGYSSYNWNTGASGDFIYANLSGYYWVTVTDANGCSAVSAQQHIAVFPVTPPRLSTADSLICSTDSTRITALGTYSSYDWSTGATGNYIYANYAGGYWVTVTDANGCSAVSGHQEIDVYPVPSVSIVEQGDTLYSFGAVSYQWYFNDSLIPNATTPEYIAHKSGNYSVLITDTNGCTALSDNALVNITGISEPGAGGALNIYPNPLGNTLFVYNDRELGITSVEIYDLTGRLTFGANTGSSNLNPLKLDVSSLPAGSYFVVVKCATSESYYRQVVKISGRN